MGQIPTDDGGGDGGLGLSEEASLEQARLPRHVHTPYLKSLTFLPERDMSYLAWLSLQQDLSAKPSLV